MKTVTLKGSNAILYAHTCGSPLFSKDNKIVKPVNIPDCIDEPESVFTIAVISWSPTAKLLNKCDPIGSISDSNTEELNLALDLVNKGLLFNNRIEGCWRKFGTTLLGQTVFQIEKLRIDLAHYLSD